MLSDPAAIRRANEALVALVHEQMPHKSYRQEGIWKPLAAGLILRMAGTVENLTRLLGSRHEDDSLVLLRALYEHVVTFCWIAIEPEDRHLRWHHSALAWRLKLHDDAKRLGLRILSAKEEAEAREARGSMPSLPDRASEADTFWADHIHGFLSDLAERRDARSLRGMYTGLYRLASQAAHAQPETVDSYAKNKFRTLPRTIEVPASGSLFYIDTARPVFAYALLVNQFCFGWPSSERVWELVRAA